MEFLKQIICWFIGHSPINELTNRRCCGRCGHRWIVDEDTGFHREYTWDDVDKIGKQLIVPMVCSWCGVKFDAAMTVHICDKNPNRALVMDVMAMMESRKRIDNLMYRAMTGPDIAPDAETMAKLFPFDLGEKGTCTDCLQRYCVCLDRCRTCGDMKCEKHKNA